MKDLSKVELQCVIDGICKYLQNNRNHIAQVLYREMHRDDCLGNSGHIFIHNSAYDIEIILFRKERI